MRSAPNSAWGSGVPGVSRGRPGGDLVTAPVTAPPALLPWQPPRAKGTAERPQRPQGEGGIEWLHTSLDHWLSHRRNRPLTDSSDQSAFPPRSASRRRGRKKRS